VQLGESNPDSASQSAQHAAPAGGPSGGPAPTRRASAQRVFLERLLLGHFIAYPVGLVAAIGSIPIAMKFREHAVLAAGPDGAKSDLVRQVARDLHLSPMEAAQSEIILTFVMWVTLAVLLVVHLGVLPWAIGAARAARSPDSASSSARQGLRSFVIVTTVTLAVVILCGAAGWIWLFTL